MYNQPSRPYRSNNSPRFGNQFGSRNRFRSQTKRKFTGQRIDVNKFINKATATVAEEVYKPQHKFADFALNPTLKSNILAKGFDTPTPIQDQTITPALEGWDILGIANTGTGKTAAFLIPLINKIANNHRERVLIITPTRELALQIQQELKEFTRGMNQFSTLVIGGANMGQQIARLRRDPHFIIGTPGRLKDLLERNHLQLNNIHSVVLDEADRMLDMGFVDDIKRMFTELPSERQTLFFSATMSPRIEILTKQFLRTPVVVSVKKRDTSSHVDQDIVCYEQEDLKIEQLHDLLVQPEFKKVLVFGQTKHGVETLSESLAERGFSVTAIHGNKTQPQRQRSLAQFKDDSVQIMIATDVAARGLDIPNVTHVINYDLPMSYEDYIHRIGRTGRANNKGYALTFVSGQYNAQTKNPRNAGF